MQSQPHTTGSHTDSLLPHRQYRHTNRWDVKQSSLSCATYLTALRSATSRCVARLSAPHSTGVLLPGRRPNMMIALARTLPTHPHTHPAGPPPKRTVNRIGYAQQGHHSRSILWGGVKIGRPPSPRLSRHA